MAGREVDRLGRREGLAIGISMNLGKTVPRVAGGVSVDRIIIEHANNLGHVSSRSEEHTSELQSLMRISYAVFCLKKQQYQTIIKHIKSQYTHVINSHVKPITNIYIYKYI